MPISTIAPRDPDWEQLLILASYPLRKLDSAGRVVGSASACIVGTDRTHVLLTVEHATRDQGRWAIELRHDAARGTQLYQLGTMHFLAEVDLGKREGRVVDIAYAQVPPDLVALYPVHPGITPVAQEQRVVLALNALAVPEKGARYGFSGQVKVDRFDDADQVHSDVELETGLYFEREDAAYDIYRLDHSHPGDEQYRGCSGAPVLGVEGQLVGLLSRGHDAETVRVLPLRRYRAAILALFG